MGQNPEQKIVKLNQLVQENLKLTIPVYQRPYKWTDKNVIQLLDDIFQYVILKNKTYRIGSLILHYDEKLENNIVDGQQRLTTISLLLRILDQDFK
eukprot:gene38144-61586_t